MPKSLYPRSKSTSKFQRITVAACVTCNNGTADDDAHFRNVILVAGEKNSAVAELWDGPVHRAFAQVDGVRRAREIFALMEPADGHNRDRYMIYPARDARVLKTVRKIVRGLSHYHNLMSPVSDDHVFADIKRSALPEAAVNSFVFHHAEPDILRYGFMTLEGDPDLHSVWVLQFFERTTFIAAISQSAKGFQSLAETLSRRQ